MEEEKKEKAFVIKDRRHFDETGSLRQDEDTPQAKQPEPEVNQTKVPPEKESSVGTQDGPLPEVNFASFIFSLSTTAMYHFGDFPDPETQEPRKNLPAAKQTIDILSLLKTKTEGNLDEAEKELLDGILYELRLRFVKEMSKR